jgi:hypothetical protein
VGGGGWVGAVVSQVRSYEGCGLSLFSKGPANILDPSQVCARNLPSGGAHVGCGFSQERSDGPGTSWQRTLQ